ncbi:hypothetical protein INT47_000358 [Mucor saturninus]|uniref:Uncharacterized protein n=1 Tax=Mucor saturninus TaxID=64648 RepID=A0A8H7QYD6_9FUNG|nr:hypothetical protein INT47_000358 [Mucor saturninus]
MGLPVTSFSSLQSYNNIITEYLYNPRSYPQKIVFDEHLSDVACIRFALFNVLYGTDMQPLQYNHDDTFKFSDAWVQLLKESKRSNAFLIETQVIENALRNPEWVSQLWMNRCINSTLGCVKQLG